MGDENTALDEVSARHLLRRAGFGATEKQVQDMLGPPALTRGQAADALLDFKVGTARKPGGNHIENVHDKRLKFMIKTKYPLQEKLVLFWHDHFATSNVKVNNPKTMANQNRLLRSLARGNMKDLVKAINRDAAMIEFLDTVRNHKQVPNENYARELQELFTLGVYDFAGNSNYAQADIVQIARAFTGWDYEYDSGATFLNTYDHDYMANYPGRGPKVIYKTTGGFGAAGRSFTVNGEGEPEIDTVIDIIFDHTDTNGKKTVARRTARRLFEYFARAIPDPISAGDIAIIDAIVAQSGFDTNVDVGLLVRAILTHDAFYETSASAPFTTATKKSVSWPADYVVTTLRLLGVKPKRFNYIAGGSYQPLRDQLSNMGQLLLEPPSVFGWNWETAWISTSALLARYNFARDVTSARDGGSISFRPERLSWNGVDLVTMTDPDDIVDAVTGILGVNDQLTAGEKTVLRDYLTDNGANPTLHFLDEDPNGYETRNTKLHGLFALVLQSPAYQLH